MGYLLGLNDEMPYHLVLITRKLITKVWTRREYILANMNDRSLRKEAIEDVNLT